jgi:hypothetical protein
MQNLVLKKALDMHQSDNTMIIKPPFDEKVIRGAEINQLNINVATPIEHNERTIVKNDEMRETQKKKKNLFNWESKASENSSSKKEKQKSDS